MLYLRLNKKSPFSVIVYKGQSDVLGVTHDQQQDDGDEHRWPKTIEHQDPSNARQPLGTVSRMSQVGIKVLIANALLLVHINHIVIIGI